MSNRLPILQAQVADLHKGVLHHTTVAAEKALAAWAALAEAKALCGHGAWGNFLAEAELPERTARRYMTLHRLALKSATVADLGGVAAAAEWGGRLKLPKSGEALVAAVGDWGAEPYQPLGMVWRNRQGHLVGFMDLDERYPQAWITRRPLTIERAVWATLWHLTEHQHHRLPDLQFEALTGDGWRGMAAELTAAGAGL